MKIKEMQDYFNSIPSGFNDAEVVIREGFKLDEGHTALKDAAICIIDFDIKTNEFFIGNASLLPILAEIEFNGVKMEHEWKQQEKKSSFKTTKTDGLNDFPATYCIAKYIPDLMRNEPRNIGVLLWTPTRVDSMFIGDNNMNDGIENKSELPKFINSKGAYEQWVLFWRKELKKDVLESYTSPSSEKIIAKRNEPNFLEVLAMDGKGNFKLADFGGILDPIEDFSDALEYLFDRLVREARNG